MLPKAVRRTPLMITISKKAVPPLLGLSAEGGGPGPTTLLFLISHSRPKRATAGGPSRLPSLSLSLSPSRRISLCVDANDAAQYFKSRLMRS